MSKTYNTDSKIVKIKLPEYAEHSARVHTAIQPKP